MNDQKKPTRKTCPRCAKTFDCLHAAGCWCFDYTLTPENLLRLQKEYDNCLCPNCLKDYSVSAQDNTLIN